MEDKTPRYAKKQKNKTPLENKSKIKLCLVYLCKCQLCMYTNAVPACTYMHLCIYGYMGGLMDGFCEYSVCNRSYYF